MNRSKIDNDILLQMLSEGKTQKECATFFGVSEPAITKRLKRLSSETVLDKYDLTDKEKAFALEKSMGKTNTQAALASFECGSLDSAKSVGSRLMDKAEIRRAIDELMEEHGLTRSYRIRKLKTHVDNRDPNVSLKALDLSWKLDASYAPEQLHIRSEAVTLDLTEQAYREMIASKYRQGQAEGAD